MENKKSAYLILEDGSIYQGKSFGKGDYTEGEVVFNTGITGYQEVLTDPSYAGQIVVMTYPQIGNYGFIPQESESGRIQVKGFIVREHCYFPNNYQCQSTVDQFLNEHHILGIEGIDTREITRKIRSQGTMKGYITTTQFPGQKMIALARGIVDIDDQDLVEKVTATRETVLSHAQATGLKIAVIDLGLKSNIARLLHQLGHEVYILPARTSARQIMEKKYNLVLLSNGPGNPKNAPYVVDLVRQLIGHVPLTGICLGLQMIALALGLDTFKLKFGHRGGNHPVKNLTTQKVHITTQNHGYAVKNENIPPHIELTHINLNDQTIEGFRVKEKKIFCVQFHPEAAPGPEDCHNILQEFVKIAQ